MFVFDEIQKNGGMCDSNLVQKGRSPENRMQNKKRVDEWILNSLLRRHPLVRLSLNSYKWSHQIDDSYIKIHLYFFFCRSFDLVLFIHLSMFKISNSNLALKSLCFLAMFLLLCWYLDFREG